MLGCFLGLKEKYAFVRPMIFDKDILDKYSEGKRSRGYISIRYALYYDAIQDLVKLAFDKTTKKTPSIINALNTLNHDALRNVLCENFAKREHPVPSHDEKEVEEALIELEETAEAERREMFVSTYDSILERWDEVEQQHWVNGFKTVRDKLTAHLELRCIDGKYIITDVAELGLKWSDLGDAIKIA